MMFSVENLAYEKDSFVNSRRQHKRHTRRNQQQQQQQQRQHSNNHDHATEAVSTTMDSQQQQPVDRQNAVDSGIHSCTVLDNFYVETPVFMVDLGKKTTVSGVIIITWPGNPNGSAHVTVVIVVVVVVVVLVVVVVVLVVFSSSCSSWAGQEYDSLRSHHYYTAWKPSRYEFLRAKAATAFSAS